MPRTAKPPVALPQEARERLLTLIAQSSEPLSAKYWAAGLSEFFKATDKQVAALLTELVAAGALHEFAPLKGKALRYWDRGLADYARDVLLKTLTAKGSLTLERRNRSATMPATCRSVSGITMTNSSPP